MTRTAPEEWLAVTVSTSAMTVAVLLRPLAQSAAVVVVVRVMVLVEPGAIVPKWQVSVPALIEQLAASGPQSVQECRALGIRSVRVTPVELPVPLAVTVML